MKLTNFLFKYWYAYLLIFLLSAGIRFYKVTQKTTLYGDEALSVTICAYNDYGWNKFFSDSTAYTGKEIRSALLFDNERITNALNDIRKLHLDTRDAPHTNFYYSLLRLWFAGDKTDNIHHIILKGFWLNFLLFTLSFIFYCVLIKRIFKNDLLILLTLFIAFINPAAIANTLYLRPYQLQETFFIIYSYIFVIYYQKIKKHHQIDTWKDLCIISLLTALTLLSGYYSLIFVLFLGIILIILSYKTKQKQNVIYLLITFCFSFLLTEALYAKYLDGFIGYKSIEIFNKLNESQSFAENIKIFLASYFRSIDQMFLGKYLIIALIILLAAIIIFYRKNLKKTNYLILLLATTALFWSLIIMFLTPSFHYIMSSFPIITLFIPFLLSYTNRTVQKVSAIIIIPLILINILNNKEFFIGEYTVAANYLKNKNIPAVFCIDHYWEYNFFLSYFNDERVFYFPRSASQYYNYLNQFKDVFVIQSPEYAKKWIVPVNYQTTDSFKCNDWYYGKRLKKIN